MKSQDVLDLLREKDIEFNALCSGDDFVKVSFDKRFNFLRFKNAASKKFKNHTIIDLEQNLNDKSSPLYNEHMGDEIRFVVIIFKQEVGEKKNEK